MLPPFSKIAGIGARLGPGVGRQETQAIGELLFRLGLKGMIVTVSVGGGISSVLPKIRERADRLAQAGTGGE